MGVDLATSQSYKGVVYVIPLSAPLPQELEGAGLTTGPLLKRLAPLADKDHSDDITIVALSGSELSSLERVWSQIVEARQVAVLTELPGASYDTLFMHAKTVIGIRSVDWPSIERSVADTRITEQRTKDLEPWNDKDARVSKDELLPKAKGSTLKGSDQLDTPDYNEEEDENGSY
jgi:hypothetical protein